MILNSGFAAMIPADDTKEPEPEQEDVKFNHAIEFSLLNHFISLKLNVKKKV